MLVVFYWKGESMFGGALMHAICDFQKEQVSVKEDALIYFPYSSKTCNSLSGDGVPYSHSPYIHRLTATEGAVASSLMNSSIYFQRTYEHLEPYLGFRRGGWQFSFSMVGKEFHRPTL
jgi:hypothetical protein